MNGSRTVRFLTVGLVCALLAGMAMGCSKDAESDSNSETVESAEDSAAQGEASDSAAPDSASDAAASDAAQIPRGREIAEGGGGPIQYTFREEWRRALISAQKWRAGAYLVSAVGDYVNDDGVPSEWRMTFVDSDSPDALLWVYIDPWGNVTDNEQQTGDTVTSNVTEYDAAIPYDVLDSDEAVRIAKETLGARYDLADTKDPRISIGWSVIDGSGPYWSYNLFYTPTAEYISAQIDARTGEVALQE